MDHICLHHPPVFPPIHIRLGISLCYTDTRPSDWVYKLHASHFLPQTWVTLEFSFAGMSLPWLQFQWAPVEPAAWTSLQSFLVDTSSHVCCLSTHSFPRTGSGRHSKWFSLVTYYWFSPISRWVSIHLLLHGDDEQFPAVWQGRANSGLGSKVSSLVKY